MLSKPVSGVKAEEIRKRRIFFGGGKGYLDGILGDPSRTTIQGQMWTNLRKYKKNCGKQNKTYVFLVFLCFDPRV